MELKLGLENSAAGVCIFLQQSISTVGSPSGEPSEVEPVQYVAVCAVDPLNKPRAAGNEGP